MPSIGWGVETGGEAMVPAYNHGRQEYVNVEAGFLIVKMFVQLYGEYKDRYGLL